MRLSFSTQERFTYEFLLPTQSLSVAHSGHFRDQIIAATVLTLAFSFSACADINGTVVGVADGDTLTVLDANRRQHKIRLTGIDAPEKKQSFGNSVRIDDRKKDRYGRTLGSVWIASGTCKLAKTVQRRSMWAWRC